MTRVDSTSGDWYDTSAHLVWIGERTRDLDGAHVEFFKGIKNPIGMKCGPTMEPDDLLRLIDALNPENEPGRLTLYGRFGHDKIAGRLPALLRATKAAGKKVVWAIDPMHGNTLTANNGYKTRPFDRILSEVKSFVEICKAEGRPSRRRPPGNDRPERHRMHRRRPRSHRGRPRRPLPHPLRPAPER